MAAPTAPAGVELLRSDVRRRLLDHLAELPLTAGAAPGQPTRERGMTAAELAAVVGLHVTTVRFHVDRLVRAGLLVASTDRPTGAGRPRKRYAVPTLALEPPEDAGARAAYEELTALLGDSLTGPDGVPAHPEEAGYRWALEHVGPQVPEHQRAPARTPGGWLGKVGGLVDVLASWGYAPDVRTGDGGGTTEVLLHQCPFLPLARLHPDVTCGVHRGLLRGTLEALGEDAAVSLEPFVTPTTCRAHLAPRQPLTAPGGTR